MFTFFLWLHILSAIIAFGPTFTFPLLGAMVAKEPQHALFVVRFQESFAMKMLYPLGLVVLPITGIGMIVVNHIPLFDTTWLLTAIGLFVVAAGYSTAVQTPTGMKLMHLLEKMPPGPPPEGSAGPPPEVAALVKKLQMGGMFLMLMVVVILAIMVWGTMGKLS